MSVPHWDSPTVKAYLGFLRDERDGDRTFGSSLSHEPIYRFQQFKPNVALLPAGDAMTLWGSGFGQQIVFFLSTLRPPCADQEVQILRRGDLATFTSARKMATSTGNSIDNVHDEMPHRDRRTPSGLREIDRPR
jgi:hypothetical protein